MRRKEGRGANSYKLNVLYFHLIILTSIPIKINIQAS